ncbi:protein NIM1-INTERACTING 1 [Cucurbita pepo subsp. pepo]|uniref:protein NIM1-INTERACTING 1 n=1 Tax=Cucurbita pepo subsp. pepo TaxID=3664 RepID=UPI000C9D4796|nr:protein NIM1-INTERACTING 1 [Cucurbita pepo subsp. pepo]
MEKQSLKPTGKRVAVAAVDGEEEEEEMKMEAFFALVRNFKEMRDQRRKELMIGCDGEKAAAAEMRKRKMKTVENRSAWIPRFEREDFDEEFQLRGPAKEEAAAAAKKKKKVKNEEDILDLNLSL